MTSLFTRIIEGELPGHFALRDDQCVVFMTISPICSARLSRREGRFSVVFVGFDRGRM